jgi:hypothetical protein
MGGMMNFTNWLQKQVDRDDDVGEFARDALMDNDRPIFMGSNAGFNDRWKSHLGGGFKKRRLEIFQSAAREYHDSLENEPEPLKLIAENPTDYFLGEMGVYNLRCPLCGKGTVSYDPNARIWGKKDTIAITMKAWGCTAAGDQKSKFRVCFNQSGLRSFIHIEVIKDCRQQLYSKLDILEEEQPIEKESGPKMGLFNEA